jgi:hypothetical protein
MWSFFSVKRWLFFLLLALVLMMPLPAFALTPEQVYESVKDSVLVVKVYDQRGRLVGFGSGVMLPLGDIVTNYHVIKSGVRYSVGQAKEAKPATLKGMDKNKDLCLLSAPGIEAKPATLGQAAKLKVGQPVYAVGAPQGLELSLSEGIVSQLRGVVPPIIQTTVPISPGSSGGGLFNAEGELVGITTFQLKEGQNLNFALPVEWIGLVAKRKTEYFPVPIEQEQKFVTLYSASGPVHLGDEEFPDWPPLHGTCFGADFSYDGPIEILTLKLQTYGIEITAPIYLNNHKVAVLPPQRGAQTRKTRPNEWTRDISINIPTDKLINGLNKLVICTDLVGRPEFPGDKDDFQFRNFRIIVK